MNNKNLDKFWNSLNDEQKDMFVKLIKDMDGPDSYDLTNELNELVESK